MSSAARCTAAEGFRGGSQFASLRQFNRPHDRRLFSPAVRRMQPLDDYRQPARAGIILLEEAAVIQRSQQAGQQHELGAAPLVAVLLLLCGELAAWSLDERLRMRTDPGLVWRRAGAAGLLALGGLALATLALVLGSVPTAHGLLFTVAGALAAVSAAGTGILLARR